MYVTALIFFLTFCTVLFSQTIQVTGNVHTSSVPVQYALVTFIDKADTSKKYSTVTDSIGNFKVVIITSIPSKPNSLTPQKIDLAQNYPNPFSTSTAISYQLNKQADVNVTIYDILGREVKRFAIGSQNIGTHGVTWDGKNIFGKKVAMGVYFYRLQTKDETVVKKMVLIDGSTPLPVSFTLNNFLPTSKVKKSESLLNSTEYTIQIKNTDTTHPKIFSTELIITINQNPTTLDIQVLQEDVILPLAVGNKWTYATYYSYGLGDTLVWEVLSKNIVHTASGKHDAYGMNRYIKGDNLSEIQWLFANSPDGLYVLGGLAKTDTLITRFLWLKYPSDSTVSYEVPIIQYSISDEVFYFKDTLTYSLVSIDDTLETPANKFTNCFVYKYKIKPADDVSCHWIFSEYFVPNVGLVGTVAVDECDNKVKFRLLLISYTIK